MRNLYYLLFIGVLSVSLLGFYASIGGNKGILAIKKIEDEIHSKSLIIEKLEAEKALLERKIRILETQNIESDYIEELIKKNTNYTNPNEIVILLNDEE